MGQGGIGHPGRHARAAGAQLGPASWAMNDGDADHRNRRRHRHRHHHRRRHHRRRHHRRRHLN